MAALVYFPLAHCFKISYVEDAPQRDDVAAIDRIVPSATPGTFYAHMWLPNHVTKATVYENGASIGPANVIYDDPNRTFSLDGKRWKYVEFNTHGDYIQRWIVFSD